MRCLKLGGLLLFIFCLTGCLQQQADETLLRQNIGTVLTQYQNGVNDLNRRLLESIISDKFSFYEQGRTEYIDGLLKMTVLLDKIRYGNIRIENYKIFADAETNGSIVFRPEVELPLFKTIPFMSGKLQKKSVFAFMYEENGELKILAEDPVLTEKNIIWGKHPPAIREPVLSAYRVAPGDSISVGFQIDKSENDIVFVYINEQLLGGYALDEYIAEGIDYTVKVPAALKRGDDFEIKLMVFGGKVDLNNPRQADLQGAAIRTYVLPVR